MLYDNQLLSLKPDPYLPVPYDLRQEITSTNLVQVILGFLYFFSCNETLTLKLLACGELAQLCVDLLS